MSQEIQKNMTLDSTLGNSSTNVDLAREIQQSISHNSTQVCQHNVDHQPHTEQITVGQDMVAQSAPKFTTQSNIQKRKFISDVPYSTGITKKNSRNRMTSIQRQNFIEQCVDRYLNGWSAKLIAYDLDVREADVKHVLFDFVQKHQDKIIQAKIFLATPNTRIKDISGKNSSFIFYEVMIHPDGTMVCKPIRQSSHLQPHKVL